MKQNIFIYFSYCSHRFESTNHREQNDKILERLLSWKKFRILISYPKSMKSKTLGFWFEFLVFETNNVATVSFFLRLNSDNTVINNVIIDTDCRRNIRPFRHSEWVCCSCRHFLKGISTIDDGVCFNSFVEAYVWQRLVIELSINVFHSF